MLLLAATAAVLLSRRGAGMAAGVCFWLGGHGVLLAAPGRFCGWEPGRNGPAWSTALGRAPPPVLPRSSL